MGCFDTVLVPCPKCGELFEAQSKSGDCILMTYNFEDAPDDVMGDVNRHAPFICEKCHTAFMVSHIYSSVEINSDKSEDE